MIHRRTLLAALAAAGLFAPAARAQEATTDTLEITGGFARARRPSRRFLNFSL